MACTLPPLVRKGRALKFAHIATEIVMSELTFACGLCGNTNEPSYVSTSFGESCLFLLSGFTNHAIVTPGIGLPGDRDSDH